MAGTDRRHEPGTTLAPSGTREAVTAVSRVLRSRVIAALKVDRELTAPLDTAVKLKAVNYSAVWYQKTRTSTVD